VAIDRELMEKLGDDIDLRLADVQRAAWEHAELRDVDPLVLTVVLRLAYGCGYMDALGEDAEGTPAALLRKHGLRLPAPARRRAAGRPGR
jgi:hypothetical protein